MTQPERPYAVFHESDTPEIVFDKTVTSASRMLWRLGAAEQCLSALYDVLEAAVGERDLWDALSMRPGVIR